MESTSLLDVHGFFAPGAFTKWIPMSGIYVSEGIGSFGHASTPSKPRPGDWRKFVFLPKGTDNMGGLLVCFPFALHSPKGNGEHGWMTVGWFPLCTLKQGISRAKANQPGMSFWFAHVGPFFGHGPKGDRLFFGAFCQGMLRLQLFAD